MSRLLGDFTFTEQLLLNLAGPALTIAVGTLAIGYLARKAQDRRDDQLQRAQDRREDFTLRERLLSEATEAPSALYLATQHYWRAKSESLADDELKQFRAALDHQYLDSRRNGVMLEHLLELHFTDPKPAQLMHRVMDLLLIRYFQLIRPDGPSDKLRRLNAGDEHTGLAADELKRAEPVLDKYHATLRELVVALTTGELQVNPGLQAANGATPAPH